MVVNGKAVNGYSCNYYEYSLNIDNWELSEAKYNYTITAIDYFHKEKSISGSFESDTTKPEFKDYNSDGSFGTLVNSYDINAEGKAIVSGGFIAWEKAVDKESSIRNYKLILNGKDAAGNEVSKEVIVYVNAKGEPTQMAVAYWQNENLVDGERYTVTYGEGVNQKTVTTIASEGSLRWSAAAELTGEVTIRGTGIGEGVVMAGAEEYGNFVIVPAGKYTVLEVLGAPVSTGLLEYTNGNMIVGEKYTVAIDINGDGTIGDNEKFTGVAKSRQESGKPVTYVQFVTGSTELGNGSIVISGAGLAAEGVDISNAGEYNFFGYAFDISQWNLDGQAYTYEITAEDLYGHIVSSGELDLVVDDKAPAYFLHGDDDLGYYVDMTEPDAGEADGTSYQIGRAHV